MCARLGIWTEGQWCSTGDCPCEQVGPVGDGSVTFLASFMPLLLAIQAKRGGLKIAFQFELNAVADPPRAGSARRSIGSGFAFDPPEFVFRIRIKPLDRKSTR